MATLAELQTRRDALWTAWDRIVNRGAESYTMPDGRVFTALKIDELRESIDWLEQQIGSRTLGGRRNYSARKGAV